MKRFNKFLILFTFIFAISGLVACGGDGDKASKLSDEAKSARFTNYTQAVKYAKSNSASNAKRFRAENAQYKNWNIIPNGGSTIQMSKTDPDKDCFTGDGFATIVMENPDNPAEKVSLQCSTISADIGCMTDEYFNSRAEFADQKGVCSKNLPPLTSISM